MKQGLFVLLFWCVVAQGQSWVVRPEWVRAHEEFLASDVMAGRGSATRDEEIAATYVASEFEGYGLQPAPGMTGYLQSAAVRHPLLDGKAILTLGSLTLQEGTDFTLVISSGGNAGGKVQRVNANTNTAPAVLDGAVLLVDAIPAGRTAVQAMGGQRSGASVLVVPEDGSVKDLEGRLGGKTRTPTSLQGERVRSGGTIVALLPAAIVRVQAVKDGAEGKLVVHEREGETQKTFNAVGYLPGSDASAGTLLLTAHLDHLPPHMPGVNGDTIYNGANDDAAGTTAVLELAHALAAGPKLRRSVLFVCYGSEELGGLGSRYFGEHPPVPLGSLVANLEFEMIGNQDPKMAKGVLLLTGWERSNLGPELRKHGALLGPDPYPEQHFFERSDNYSLALKGVVAHTAAGWGTPPTYHQPDDDLAHLDLVFMTSAIQSLVEPMRWLAGSDFKPSWNAGGQPKR